MNKLIYLFIAGPAVLGFHAPVLGRQLRSTRLAASSDSPSPISRRFALAGLSIFAFTSPAFALREPETMKGEIGKGKYDTQVVLLFVDFTPSSFHAFLTALQTD